jgi:hypothetical protein
MKWFAALMVAASCALLVASCASYQAQAEPGRDLHAYRRYWVKSNFDDNHALDRVIASALRARGLAAEAGHRTMMPADIEVIVTFSDRWAWDFKNHLTALEITLLDAKTEAAIAIAVYAGPASLNTPISEVVARLVEKLFAAAPRPMAPEHGT